MLPMHGSPGAKTAAASEGSQTAADTDSLVRELVEDGFEFRLLDSSEITATVAEEMVALFRAGFGRWPYHDPGVCAVDHLRWKTSGPVTRVGSLHCRLDGRLVFANTAFGNWVRLRGVRRLRLVLPDATVDPAARGRRIYSRSVEYRNRVVRTPWDFSMHERSSSDRLEQRLAREGRRPLGNRIAVLHRVLRPVRPKAASRGDEDRSPPAVMTALWALGRLVAAVARPKSRLRVAPGTLDARFDRLFEEAASSFDCIAERTGEFLRWRYGDRRAGPFVVRTVAEGDRLLGYLVLRSGAATAYVADLLALPGREDVVDVLVGDAVDLAAKAGTALVGCWLPRRHPYRRSLVRHGFFVTRRDAGVSYHAVDMDPEELRFLEDPQTRVHYTIGDTDLV